MKDVYIIVGLGFGDEGKGNTVNYFARKSDAQMVVRFNGGCQAAHFVTLDNGESHCCSQFTSASPLGRLSYLSEHMYVEPFALVEEANVLQDKVGFSPWDTIRIHPHCPVVTPYHRLIGQMVELSKGDSRHGSVGLGVGQAVFDFQKKGVKDALVFGDIDRSLDDSLRKLSTLKGEVKERAEMFVMQNPTNQRLVRRRDEINNINPLELTEQYIDILVGLPHPIEDPEGKMFPECFSWGTPTIFEGAQGALLDFKGGFWPHVTKSNTTVENAESLIIWGVGKGSGDFPHTLNVREVGVLRAYDHRHGPGPFPSEDEALKTFLLEYDNSKNGWQGDFRVGWFDLVMSQYALDLNKGRIGEIVLTNLDKLSLIPHILICEQYEYTGKLFPLLNEFFEWEHQRSTNQVFITKIIAKERSIEGRQLLTDLLEDCRPVYSLQCEGWMTDLSKIEKFEDFPGNARKYIDLLEWHLDVPITIVSKGDSWKDKVERK